MEQQVERFKKLVEGAFSPITKVLISLSKEGVVLFQRHSYLGKPAVGLLVTVGVRSQEAVAVLTWVRWVLLRERGT